jgi:hypothetical protein
VNLSKRLISCLYGPTHRDMVMFVVLLGYVAVADSGALDKTVDGMLKTTVAFLPQTCFHTRGT